MNNPSYLLLDLGNSSLKAVLSLPGSLGTVQSWPHAQIDQLSAWLATLPQRPAHAVMASVVQPALQDAVAQALRPHAITLSHWQRTPLPTGFTNAYQAPTLGADRLAGAVGACSVINAPVLVLATFGTATTVDVVVHHQYQGGVIVPGVQMMLSSLNQGTAQLPLGQGRFVPVPATTHDALFTGMCAAQQGAVAHMLQAARTHGTPRLVVSGGAAPVMVPHLPAHMLLPHAVLQGLAVVAPLSAPTT
jgi:type III pantothenate kinase